MAQRCDPKIYEPSQHHNSLHSVRESCSITVVPAVGKHHFVKACHQMTRHPRKLQAQHRSVNATDNHSCPGCHGGTDSLLCLQALQIHLQWHQLSTLAFWCSTSPPLAFSLGSVQGRELPWGARVASELNAVSQDEKLVLPGTVHLPGSFYCSPMVVWLQALQ